MNDHSLQNQPPGGRIAVGAVLSEAWQRIKGAKGTLWLATAIYMLVSFTVSFVAEMANPDAADWMLELLFFVGVSLVTLPLMVGVAHMGIARAMGPSPDVPDMFRFFGKALALLGTHIVMSLMITLGLLLLVLPGIYLIVAYSFALQLVAERDLGIWQALETSRKAVHKNWFQVLGVQLSLGLLTVIAMIPAFIGLIWMVPMWIVAFGIMYRQLFEARTLAGPAGDGQSLVVERLDA
jgi:uncharacterized membrane protein